MIGIVDYGAGNLASVERAFAALGAETRLVTSREDFEALDAVVLPGVGHFGAFVRESEARGLRIAILDWIASNRPLLGICLGLQVLGEGSDEAPDPAGFGVLSGWVARLPEGVRVPHMGWNAPEIEPKSRLLAGLGERPAFYFANSFALPVIADTVAVFEHGGRHTAAVERGNLFGVQFHPEKSGEIGLKVLANFVEVARGVSAC